MTITEWILAVLGLIGTTSGLIAVKKSIELDKENEALKKKIKEYEFWLASKIANEGERPHPPAGKIETP